MEATEAGNHDAAKLTFTTFNVIDPHTQMATLATTAAAAATQATAATAIIGGASATLRSKTQASEDNENHVKLLNHNCRRNVYICGLPPTCTSESFRELCSQYGHIEASRISVDASCTPTKGHGFALFTNEESARRCVEGLDRQRYPGDKRRRLRVRFADAQATPHPTQHTSSSFRKSASISLSPSFPPMTSVSNTTTMQGDTIPSVGSESMMSSYTSSTLGHGGEVEGGRSLSTSILDLSCINPSFASTRSFSFSTQQQSSQQSQPQQQSSHIFPPATYQQPKLFIVSPSHTFPLPSAVAQPVIQPSFLCPASPNSTSTTATTIVGNDGGLAAMGPAAMSAPILNTSYATPLYPGVQPVQQVLWIPYVTGMPPHG